MKTWLSGKETPIRTDISLSKCSPAKCDVTKKAPPWFSSVDEVLALAVLLGGAYLGLQLRWALQGRWRSKKIQERLAGTKQPGDIHP
jgi:hypothetical protein